MTHQQLALFGRRPPHILVLPAITTYPHFSSKPNSHMCCDSRALIAQLMLLLALCPPYLS